jgi:purine-nucleoside phosphorylase
MSLSSQVKQVHDTVPFDVEIGIICGSGLGGLATEIKNKIEIEYTNIKGFPQSQVVGHANKLIFGDLGGKKVVAMQGRFHFYEGWQAKDCVKGVELMAALGVKTIVVTNAAGGLDKSFKVGDLMLIEDHISLVGMVGNNPLMGHNDDSVGPRFPSVSSVYDAELGALFRKVHDAKKAEVGHGHELRKGTYIGLSGPNYESRAEIEFCRTVGASAVGMSTVMEVVAAAHAGLKVIGLSLITNACLGTHADEYNLPEPNHAEVVAETKKVEKFVQSVVADFIAQVDVSARAAAPMSKRFTREQLPATIAAEVEAAAATADACGKRRFCAGKGDGKKGFCVGKLFGASFVSGLIGGFIGAALFASVACRRHGAGSQ